MEFLHASYFLSSVLPCGNCVEIPQQNYSLNSCQSYFVTKSKASLYMHARFLLCVIIVSIKLDHSCCIHEIIARWKAMCSVLCLLPKVLETQEPGKSYIFSRKAALLGLDLLLYVLQHLHASAAFQSAKKQASDRPEIPREWRLLFKRG